MKALWIFAVFAMLMSLRALADEEIAQKLANRAWSKSACTSSEKWDLAPLLPEQAIEDYKAYLSKKFPPVRGFAEGLALRKYSMTPEGRLFGEFWISRALFDAHLTHIAQNGFATIASRPLSAENAAIQIASLDCLIQIHSGYASFGLPSGTTEKLADYLSFAHTSEQKTVVWQAALMHLMSQISDERTTERELQKTVRLTQGGGGYESLAKGLWASHRGEHEEAISDFEQFLNDPPTPIKKYIDTTHLLAAHSNYSIENFDAAIRHFKLVSKSSNELSRSLSELAWAYLLSDKYAEAIGTGTNMQAGGMRRTFAPEAPMVMAMALNELCQYPESVRAIGVFRSSYENPYRWLKAWSSAGEKRALLYNKAVSFLKKSNEVPMRVASEWVRSPLFIANQSELNLLFEEDGSASALSTSGQTEQLKLATEIIRFVQDLKPRLHEAKELMKADEVLPIEIRKDLASLKMQLLHYRRLEQAAPIWGKILESHKARVPGIQTRLLATINEDLDIMSRHMLTQLEEIAENIQLVEVEIYNGASQDIIWQNAHPDYKEIAQKIKANETKNAAEKTWNWGRVPTSSDEETEIWEDELGSFKANLFNNCSSKDKYLALKRTGRGKFQ